MTAEQRSNLNFAFPETQREHKYINVAKSASRVTKPTVPGSFYYYQNINVNQYPTETTQGIRFTVYLPGAGTYVVRWLGSGSFTSVSFGTLSNSSDGVYTGGGASGTVVTNGRMTFTPAGLASDVDVKGTTMTDFVICRLDEESLLNAGQMFRPQFLAKIAAYQPGALRFHDLHQTNESILCEWTDRAKTEFITYAGSNFVPHKKVGEITTADGIAFVAGSYAGMPGSYTDGEIIHGHIRTGNATTAPTLNVGGRGPKLIMTEYSAAPEITGTNGAVRMIAESIMTFMFDAKYDKWSYILLGAKVGNPIENSVRMCNETGVPGWFCLPFHASDDFATQFATYLCANYTPATVYIEYSNEIWNTAFGFPNTTRAEFYGLAQFPGIGTGNNAAFSGWYGYRMRQLATIIRGVFAANGQASKVKVILANQGAIGNTFPTPITEVIEDKRFQNVSFPELSGVNAPINHADLVSYGLYYGSTSIPGYTDSQWTAASATTATLKTNVDLYLTGVPESITTALNWALNDFMTSSVMTTHIQGSSGRFANWNTLALEYGKPIVVYESNHEIGPPSAAWALASPAISDATYGGDGGKIDQFIQAFFASSQYEKFVAAMLKAFYARSQSQQFSLFGYALGNPWLTHPKNNFTTESTLGGDATLAPYANWRAHALKNDGKRRMVVTT